jgi:hypothetical protein
VQVTKIELFDDRIVLQINGGFGGGRKWYQRRAGKRHMGNTVPHEPTTTTATRPAAPPSWSSSTSLSGMKAVG